MEYETLTCPRCGADMPHKTEWKLHGRGAHETTMHLHKCINPDCGATLRYKGDPKQ